MLSCTLNEQSSLPKIHDSAANSFIRDLGLWLILIFVATIAGCYIPFHIICGKNFSILRGLVDPPTTGNDPNGYPDHDSVLLAHDARHEQSMSFLMSFSGGVCLAVAFIFQVNGFSATTQLYPNNLPHAGRVAGYLIALTFCSFFVIEQVGFILQNLHAGTCELPTPCAVEVAIEPLEAASVVRFLSDHARSVPNINNAKPLIELDDDSQQHEENNVGRLGSYYYSSLDYPNASANPSGSGLVNNCAPGEQAGTLNCPLCRHKRTNTNSSSAANHWVLFFLFVLFAIHSLAEGLGLGVSGCNCLSHSNASSASDQARSVALAILLHKSLSAFAVGAALLRTEIGVGIFAALSLMFAAITPAGALLGYIICRKTVGINNAYATATLSLIAGGTFMFISLVEFLPKSFEEGSKASNVIQLRLIKTGLFLLGVILVLLTAAYDD